MSVCPSTWRVRLGLCVLCCAVTKLALAQTAVPDADEGQLTPARVRAVQQAIGARNCPGDPPGNLASFDCSFTPSQRWEEFVTGSLTDQALLGASFYGVIGHWFGDPPEWGTGWSGLRRSIGTRYTQNLTKGLAQYASSALLLADPRHVSYANDPLITNDTPPSVGARVGHVFVDWLTVRRSQIDGKGRRWPNLPMFAGAATNAYVGNAFFPDRLATTGSAVKFATSSLATALAASVYTEFSPEVGRALGALVKRGRTPATRTTVPGGHQ